MQALSPDFHFYLQVGFERPFHATTRPVDVSNLNFRFTPYSDLHRVSIGREAPGLSVSKQKAAAEIHLTRRRVTPVSRCAPQDRPPRFTLSDVHPLRPLFLKSIDPLNGPISLL